jgi:hypothetical protein
MERTPDIMGVFTVPDEIVHVSASSGKGKRVKTTKRSQASVLPAQRIGTAYRLSDGSIGVQLTAVPRNGKLVVRAATTRKARS